MRYVHSLLFGLALSTQPALAGSHTPLSATAEVAARDGTVSGTARFAATPSGETHITIRLEGIPEGIHGVHVHETGDCSAADFTSAGGHLAGDRAHGVLTEGGPHPGDLPNATVGSDQRLEIEVFSAMLTLGSDGEGAMLDGDGAALVVHADPDDYQSQPSGAAGDRIACGVIVAD